MQQSKPRSTVSVMEWVTLYRSLWENSRVLGEGPQVLIPLTLIFEGGSSEVRDWYFTHRSAAENDPPSGIYRKRLPSAADGNRDVFRQLMKAYQQEGNSEAGGVVAAMVWQEPSSSEGKSKGGGRMCTCNLLEEDLRQLLLEGRGAPSSSSPWILQAFVTPDFESPLTTIVSEPPHDIGVSTVSARFKPRVLINKYRFQSVNELSWSLAPEHVTAATKFSSDELYSIIVYQSQLSDACIHASLDSEKNFAPMSFYFRYVETTREIFLLWACPTSSRMHTVAFSSLLVGQSARPKPAPPATPPATAAPNGARNDTLLKEVFASYGMEGSSSVGAKGASNKQHQQQREQSSRPKTSGSHPSVRPGKSQKDAIAELYLKQNKPLRKMKAGQLKLPPWKEVNRVKYEEPAERLDRYEQAKRVYAVRNIGFFDPITPLPMTSLEDEPYCRPVSSSSSSHAASSSSSARPSAVGGGTSFSSGRPPIISDDVSLDLDAAGMPPNVRQFQSTPIVAAAAAAPRPAQAAAPAPAPVTIVPPSFVSVDSPEHQQLGAPLSPSVPKNPSNALRHAAQFGHKGRMIRKMRKSAEPSVNAIVAPPGSSEDLIDYTTAIIVKVCDALSWNLSMAFEFAEDHGEAIAELRKKRIAGEAVQAVPELETHSVVAEILQRLGTGGDDDREVSDDEDEEEDEEDEYQQKQKQGQGQEEEKEGKNKKKSLSAPQNSLFKVLEMLICIPNHRPADQLCTILLWLLSSAANKSTATTLDRMHDDLKSQKSMLKGFSNFAFDVRNVLAGVSANKSQRAAGKDPTTQSTIEAAVYLRSWIQDKYQIFVQEEAPPAVETTQVGKNQGQDEGDAPAFDLATYFMNATPISALDDESSPLSEILPPHAASSSSSPVSAVLQSAATTEDPALLFPKKPVFSGPIKRLGREYKVASSSSSSSAASASASASVTPAGTNHPASAPGTEKIRKVRAHLGMQLFLAALKLPGPRLFDEPPKSKEAGVVRQSLSSAVLPPTLSSYDEHPADEDEAQEGEAEKEARRLAACAPRTSSSAADREMAFFELAPSLSPGQRSLLLNSFIIDMAQSVILNMSVLSRHASAGKEVTRSDLTALFGSPVIKVMGKKLVSRLLIWLHSNRRAAGSFKNASQTLIELGSFLPLFSLHDGQKT